MDINEWIEADPRPTCLLDLASPDRPHIVHKNSALLGQGHLVHDILDPSVPDGFKAWALASEHSGAVAGAGGVSIYAYTIDKRWRYIQWLPPATQAESGQNGHSIMEKSLSEVVPLKADPLTLNRKLKDALADRDDATGKLCNLLKMMEMVDVGMSNRSVGGIIVLEFQTLPCVDDS